MQCQSEHDDVQITFLSQQRSVLAQRVRCYDTRTQRTNVSRNFPRRDIKIDLAAPEAPHRTSINQSVWLLFTRACSG